MRQDGQQGTTADDAPEARREETAILDAMDDGGEVLAVACHDQLSLPSASPRGNFPSRSLTTPPALARPSSGARLRLRLGYKFRLPFRLYHASKLRPPYGDCVGLSVSERIAT